MSHVSKMQWWQDIGADTALLQRHLEFLARSTNSRTSQLAFQFAHFFYNYGMLTLPGSR